MEQTSMKHHKRPERFEDWHIPLARLLAETKTGKPCSYPSREFRKRAADMQGRGIDDLEVIKWADLYINGAPTDEG
jgi:hypothetical protein